MYPSILFLSIIIVLLITSVVALCLFVSKRRQVNALRADMANLTERYNQSEYRFKEREKSLLDKLHTIDSTVANIEIKSSNIIVQNEDLTQQLKQKNIEIRSSEHRILKLKKESEGYDVAMFIEWLKHNNINTEQARNMVCESMSLEEELMKSKAKYDKLENEKRLLDNYAQSTSNQLQILLKRQ